MADLWKGPAVTSRLPPQRLNALLLRQIGDTVPRAFTKHRFREKYRIELRERDYLPPHVHLTGGGVDVVISLESVTVTQGRAPAKVIQEAIAWVQANQADLLKEWIKWHR